jgi:hypothetical protein
MKEDGKDKTWKDKTGRKYQSYGVEQRLERSEVEKDEEESEELKDKKEQSISSLSEESETSQRSTNSQESGSDTAENDEEEEEVEFDLPFLLIIIRSIRSRFLTICRPLTGLTFFRQRRN